VSQEETFVTRVGTTIQALVDSWESINLQLKDILEAKGRCEMMLGQAMKELGAEEFQHNNIAVTYKSKTLWQEGVLDQLKLILPEYELEPEEFLNKPRPRTWDKRKLVKLAKRGGELKQLIDSAQTDGAPIIQVKQG
jgi:hypothetical protein